MNGFVELMQTDLPTYAIVNINYRLANNTTSPFPMQLEDISAIINDLKAKNEEYIISEDYGFLGTSAGAHLSMLWSYDYDSQADVNMVASIVGPTNLADEAYLNNADPAIQGYIDLLGMDLVVPFLENFSPFHKVTNSAPPTILFYGGQDPLIPNSQGMSNLENRTITIERTFNAPLALVWEAWTQPEHIASWWAPNGAKLDIVEHNFTVGGKWKFSMFGFGRGDNLEKVQKFQKDFKATFPMHPDVSKAIYHNFATKYIPRNYIIKDGKIVYASTGFKQDEFKEMVAFLDKLLKE